MITSLDELEMATENFCDIQDQPLYKQLMLCINAAEDRGESEQQVMEQLILVLVIVALSYEQNFGLIKAVIEIYRVTVKRLASVAIAEA
jgi:hypothetical protein